MKDLQKKEIGNKLFNFAEAVRNLGLYWLVKHQPPVSVREEG